MGERLLATARLFVVLGEAFPEIAGNPPGIPRELPVIARELFASDDDFPANGHKLPVASLNFANTGPKFTNRAERFASTSSFLPVTD